MYRLTSNSLGVLTLCAASSVACAGADGHWDGELYAEEEVASSEQPIINGDTIPETTPFVFVDNSCSGTLLNADTVLTANHCISDGQVSIGSSTDLDRHDDLYSFYSYMTASANNIVGIGIAKNDHVYVWYSNGRVAAGTSDHLTEHRNNNRFSLPPGKSTSDIVGVGIAGSNDHVYAWYDDGTVSSGSSTDLDRHRSPRSYSLPPGKSPSDILAVAIAKDDKVYAWYDDGTVSSGTSTDLDRYRAPRSFSVASGASRGEIMAIGIAKSSDRTYTYYDRNDEFDHPSRIRLESGSEDFRGSDVIRHPTLDVAIVRAANNFSRPNSDAGGNEWVSLYSGSTSSLLNDRLDCYSYGRNTFSGGTGTLRRGDDVRVSLTSSNHYTIVAGGDGEIPWRGDSGGGCYKRESDNGLIITGVNSTARTRGSTVTSASQVSVPAIRDWIQDND